MLERARRPGARVAAARVLPRALQADHLHVARAFTLSPRGGTAVRPRTTWGVSTTPWPSNGAFPAKIADGIGPGPSASVAVVTVSRRPAA